MNSLIVDAVILAALGFVGWGQVVRSREVKALLEAEKNLKSAISAVKTVKRDLIMAAAACRNEGNKLRELTEAAARVAETSETARKTLSFEAARAGSLISELEVSTSVADRACNLLSEAVSRAREAKLDLESEEDVIVDDGPADRKRPSGIIRLVKG